MTSSGHMPCSVLVLAIGHSARDTYEMLHARGVPMEPKPFQIGVRIEQPQETVNRVQYGAARLEDRLGTADYSLVARGKHRSVQLLHVRRRPGHCQRVGAGLLLQPTA